MYLYLNELHNHEMKFVGLKIVGFFIIDLSCYIFDASKAFPNKFFLQYSANLKETCLY